MPRPLAPRRIAFLPGVTYFKPAGVPLRELEEVALALDELEALRLADLEGMYQEEGARQMGVSRATFARIIESARWKVAHALTSGKALRLEGGPVIHSQVGMARPDGVRGHGRHGHGWGKRSREGGP